VLPLCAKRSSAPLVRRSRAKRLLVSSRAYKVWEFIGTHAKYEREYRSAERITGQWPGNPSFL
jgi:hypothetical protein